METIDKRAILKDHMARVSRYLARCSKDVQKMTEIAVSPDEASMWTSLAVQLTAQSHGYHPANHFWPDGNDWVLGDTIDSQVRRAYLATILAKVGLTEEKLTKKVGFDLRNLEKLFRDERGRNLPNRIWRNNCITFLMNARDERDYRGEYYMDTLRFIFLPD
jgi:hypothetical protein